MKKTVLKRAISIGILSIICVILLGIGGCTKAIIPNGIINVINECGLAIDFFLNSVFTLTLDNGETGSVEDLEDGIYEIEARRKGTGELVGGETIEVWFNKIYTWHVRSSATVNITNNYGEMLSLWVDDIFLGDLGDQNSAIFDPIPYGDHKLEAKTSDGTVVATITISVLVDITYEWTINK